MFKSVLGKSFAETFWSSLCTLLCLMSQYHIIVSITTDSIFTHPLVHLNRKCIVCANRQHVRHDVLRHFVKSSPEYLFKTRYHNTQVYADFTLSQDVHFSGKGSCKMQHLLDYRHYSMPLNSKVYL